MPPGGKLALTTRPPASFQGYFGPPLEEASSHPVVLAPESQTCRSPCHVLHGVTELSAEPACTQYEYVPMPCVKQRSLLGGHYKLCIVFICGQYRMSFCTRRLCFYLFPPQ